MKYLCFLCLFLVVGCYGAKPVPETHITLQSPDALKAATTSHNVEVGDMKEFYAMVDSIDSTVSDFMSKLRIKLTIWGKTHEAHQQATTAALATTATAQTADSKKLDTLEKNFNDLTIKYNKKVAEDNKFFTNLILWGLVIGAGISSVGLVIGVWLCVKSFSIATGSLAGISAISFCFCIAAIKYFDTLALIGLIVFCVSLVVGMGLLIWHIYVLRKGLSKATATSEILKTNEYTAETKHVINLIQGESQKLIQDFRPIVKPIAVEAP